MTPAQLAEQIQKALPKGLRSVVLYGSAAASDFIDGVSSYNVLVVADRFTPLELDAIANPALAWMRAGNRAPLLFTMNQMTDLADAFPIELSDMKQSRQVLWGEDPLAKLEITEEHFRLQLERELSARLQSLREHYLSVAGKPEHMKQLMVKSLSTFLVLFRAALRLFEEVANLEKLDAMRRLATHVPFDSRPFMIIYDLKLNRSTSSDLDARSLFAEYLTAIEVVVDVVNRHIRKNPQGV